MRWQKLAQLIREPDTIGWRLRHKLEVQLDRHRPRPDQGFDFTCDQLSAALAACVPGFDAGILEDHALLQLESEIQQRTSALDRASAFAFAHNGDRTLGRLCYAACRSMEPDSVVETGVAHGVTTAYILLALHQNGRGHLRSIDLPPLSSHSVDNVGIVVPERLRDRWALYRGASREQLPKSLGDAGHVDVFVHDSLHTYSTMSWEFRTALQKLRRPGLIISDDVEGNTAFSDMVRARKPDESGVILESNKTACCAIALFQSR
ncbi:MAG: class I SAM-dependent methyltransferase [Paludibaculum sp.]